MKTQIVECSYKSDSDETRDQGQTLILMGIIWVCINSTNNLVERNILFKTKLVTLRYYVYWFKIQSLLGGMVTKFTFEHQPELKDTLSLQMALELDTYNL